MKILKADELAEHISLNGWDILQIKEISYGVQITAVKNDVKSNIRLFMNKKGRITVDFSQVKDEELKLTASSFLSYEFKDNNDMIVAPPLIGSDEAGKGDYVGALTVCALYADEDMYNKLISIGVKDSKMLKTEAIKRLATEIMEICPYYSIIQIKNARFNEMYAKMKNMNDIMAWAHATAIKNVYEKVKCKNVLIDKFGTGDKTANLLKGMDIILTQEPKGERNIAVAAASILARYAYLKNLDELSKKFNIDFIPGAGEAADDKVRELYEKYGKEALNEAVKISFKNTEKILD